MSMDVITAAEKRFTAKKYDADRKIDAATMNKVETLLRTAPSSVNSQPWHYIIADTDQGRELIAEAAHGSYVMNAEKIRCASHVVVFCVRDDMDEAHLQSILDQEDKDGRYSTAEARSAADKGRHFFVSLNSARMQEWMARQVYLSLGYTLMGVASLGLDSTPLEGVDVDRLDELLKLREQGLRSLFVLPLGYHEEGDFNAKLPKSRLPTEQIITHI